jgi:dCTP deaminase
VILSNVGILSAIDAGDIGIEPLTSRDVTKPPFNTSSIDLRLGPNVSVPKTGDPVLYRLDQPYSPDYVNRNCDAETISAARPFILKRDKFVLAQTLERVKFPIREDRPTYAARVEGRSSRARLGMLVHFTAPTIHCGYYGPITLEIINLGPNDIALVPDVYICQLIVESVASVPADAPNQFAGQQMPAGKIA